MSVTMMSSSFDDLDANEILEKRSQRFRLEKRIFEDDPVVKNDDTFCMGESSSAENADVGGVLNPGQGNQSINFKRKGVDVFDPSCAGKLFDDVLLHKNLCESKPANIMNHPLFHIPCSDLHEVIQRGLLKHSMKNKVIFSHLNKYLFYLTSCHCSKLLVDASCDTLVYHLLNTEEGRTPRWIPTKEDLLTVFCNYGASREILESWDTPLMKRSLHSEEGDSIDPRLMNLPLVLRVISLILMRHKSMCYSVKELDSLLCIILTASLDKYIMQMHAVETNLEFSKCIKSILSAYPASEWQKEGKVSQLARALHCKFQYVWINDLYFIVNNYISCPGFGDKLALSLMYVFVQGMMCSNGSISHVDHVGVEHISKIFKVDSLLNIDHHSQYFVLLMVESLVTNLIFSMNENSKELKRIRKLLSNLRIKSPHSEDMVDYLLVKELITRAATIWKLSVAEL
ncbi:uncharacterized protein LOC124155458 [Ischnura elegans]|uniref:uncharacterized protein LOC124155458 n=1 Tax=Ischnura elegans TaxID=197161 RepID=UPI001ED88DB6|nr:uncharacterized protein LOC124155458 [Ischnura elegans]XP_046385242.1 uncharacterized protein LOC124155458 [Ischnura elegans]